MNEESETPERESMPGEEEYVLARQMTRHAIPDFETDRAYLELLGKSAALGFPRALAKLGDYAMRRGMRVEAHYWLWQARKRGMRGLDQTVRGLRREWAAAGFPSERANRHDLFEDEAAAAAMALLDLSLGRNRTKAQAFLAEHFPDLLDGRSF